MDSYDALMLRNRVIENELAYARSVDIMSTNFIDKYRWPANLEEFERYPNVDWVDELREICYIINITSMLVEVQISILCWCGLCSQSDIYKSVDNQRGYDPGFIRQT